VGKKISKHDFLEKRKNIPTRMEGCEKTKVVQKELERLIKFWLSKKAHLDSFSAPILIPLDMYEGGRNIAEIFGYINRDLKERGLKCFETGMVEFLNKDNAEVYVRIDIL
jgi:hypothetical protein